MPQEQNTERLFVALDLPQGVQESLADLARGLSGIKAVPPHQIHLTLRFIGDTASGEAIQEALARIQAAPFELGIAGVGVFPHSGRPKVLWAGVGQGKQPLERLQGRIEEALLDAGLEPQDKPFSPHITLARNREARRDTIQAWQERHRELAMDPFRVDRFILFSSQLTATGAIHSREAEYPLAQEPT